MEFLREDLKHLFDGKGIDASAYEDVVVSVCLLVLSSLCLLTLDVKLASSHVLPHTHSLIYSSLKH